MGCKHPLQHEVSAERKGERQHGVHEDEPEQDLATDSQRVGDVHLGEKPSGG